MKRVSLFLLSFFFSFFPTIGFSDRSIITSRRIHLREPPAHRPTSFLKRSFFLPWESGRAAPRPAVYSILYVFISLFFIFLSHVLYACNFLYSVSRDGFLNIIFCLFLSFLLSFVFSLSRSPSQLTSLLSNDVYGPADHPPSHRRNTRKIQNLNLVSIKYHSPHVCSLIRSSLSFSHSHSLAFTLRRHLPTHDIHIHIYGLYICTYICFIYTYIRIYVIL